MLCVCVGGRGGWGWKEALLPQLQQFSKIQRFPLVTRHVTWSDCAFRGIQQYHIFIYICEVFYFLM